MAHDKHIRFGEALVKSCYDMVFYRRVRARPWWRSLSYLAGFLGLLTLAVAFSAVSDFTAIKNVVRQRVAEALPAGATVTLADGEFRASFDKPVDVGTEELPIILDPSYVDEGFPAALAKHDDGAYVGKHKVFFKNGDTRDTAAFSATDPRFSTTREAVLAWVDQYGTTAVAIATGVFGIIFYLGSFIWWTLHAALLAGLFFALAKISGLRLRYSQWFGVAVYAATLPAIVAFLFTGIIAEIVFFMIIAAVFIDERSNPLVKAGEESAS